MGITHHALTTGKMHLADGLTLAKETGARIMHHGKCPDDEAWVIGTGLVFVNMNHIPRGSFGVRTVTPE